MKNNLKLSDETYLIPEDLGGVMAEATPAAKSSVLDSVRTPATTLNARVLLNSVKSRAPLYRAALHEHGVPDDSQRAALLFRTMQAVVVGSMERMGVDPRDRDNAWLLASLSGSLAPMVAEDWIINGRADPDRLMTIAHELAAHDLSVSAPDYRDRSDNIALSFSRAASFSRANNAVIAAFSALQSSASAIDAAIDLAVDRGATAIHAVMDGRARKDDLIIRQSLYREAGETMALYGAMTARDLKKKLSAMDRQGRVAFMREHSGVIPVQGLIERFDMAFDKIVNDITSIASRARPTQTAEIEAGGLGL